MTEKAYNPTRKYRKDRTHMPYLILQSNHKTTITLVFNIHNNPSSIKHINMHK